MVQGAEVDSKRILRLLATMGGAFVLLSLLLTGLVRVAAAQEADELAANLTGSTVSASPATVVPGGTVNYTVVLSNSGGMVSDGVQVYLTDTLPAQQSYISGTFSSSTTGDSYAGSGQTVTWTGFVLANSEVTLTFSARVTNTATQGTVMTDTAAIGYDATVLTRTAAVTVADEVVTYLPFISLALPAPSVSATRPNSANAWSISWGTVPGVTGYEIQEAKKADFSDGVTTDKGMALSHDVTHPASPFNSYFYRVRAKAGSLNGAWSDPIEVVGAYRDNFNANNTEWAIRRTTFIEEVTSFYEIDSTRDWMILRVEDSWDWGIASPMKKAPKPPYVIEYRMMPANLGNLVSQGVVFGGDWNGQTCPDYSTLAGVYQHNICFNHFYNTNTIWFGKLKLLFERNDSLVWCPTCGGSPMKRLGSQTLIETIENFTTPNSWNTWRIEVRSSGIDLYVNGVKFFTFNDTRYINDPYFGIFASTDEYSNSTARFDYIAITPLDN